MVDATMSIEQVVAEERFSMVFQPLLDLRTNKPFAWEALVRCEVEAFRAPPDLLNAAVEAGLCGELGRAIRRKAVAGCDAPLFLNIHPNEFDQGFLVRPDDPMFEHEHDIYLEVTESVPLSHFDLCSGVLAEVRSKGVHLAIDDLGAGYSNLKYIADLAPEIVKLDRELIKEVESGSLHQRLLTGVVSLCRDMGALVVAEGIETDGEMGVVRESGCDFGQGFLIARPTFPPPDVVMMALDPPSEELDVNKASADT